MAGRLYLYIYQIRPEETISRFSKILEISFCKSNKFPLDYQHILETEICLIFLSCKIVCIRRMHTSLLSTNQLKPQIQTNVIILHSKIY